MLIKVVMVVLLQKLMADSDALECGVIYDATGSRIIGGYDGGSLMYPWFATLRLKVQGDPQVCAGVLITPRHILTAAHCFTVARDKPRKDVFSVALNIYDRCNSSYPGEVHQVSKATAHEKYNYPANPYDIAILTLETSSKLPRVCLPPASSRDMAESGLIMGFGYTKEGGPDQPCHLQQAQVEKYTQKQCSETNLPQTATSDPGTFCGGAPGIDSCQGDSGGPFITQGSDMRYTTSGIVSYGYGCARKGYPGIYTNVAYYLDWIAEHIDGEQTETDPKSTSQIRENEPLRPAASRSAQPHLADLFGRVNENRQNHGGSQSVRFPGQRENPGEEFNMEAGKTMGSPNLGHRRSAMDRRVSSSANEVKFPENGNSRSTNNFPARQSNTVWQGHIKFNVPVENNQKNSFKSNADGSPNGPVSLDTAEGRVWYSQGGKRLSGGQQSLEKAVTFPQGPVNSGLDPRNG